MSAIEHSHRIFEGSNGPRLLSRDDLELATEGVAGEVTRQILGSQRFREMWESKNLQEQGSGSSFEVFCQEAGRYFAEHEKLHGLADEELDAKGAFVSAGTLRVFGEPLVIAVGYFPCGTRTPEQAWRIIRGPEDEVFPGKEFRQKLSGKDNLNLLACSVLSFADEKTNGGVQLLLNHIDPVLQHFEIEVMNLLVSQQE